jgi:predicted lipid-binding transport protein (Tim44 family)
MKVAMPRMRTLLVVVLALFLAFAPGLALARAGNGGSFGSSGSFTYVAPPSTSTAPFGAMPMQRSLTPQPSPSYPSYGAPGYGTNRSSPFMSGLMGGLLGAGIGGLLFGRGLFGGISGFGGLFGLLLQVFLIVWVVRWLLRRVFGQPAVVGGGPFARTNLGGVGAAPAASGGGASARPVQIQPADYQQFEQLLQAVQAAWSADDLNGLRAMATPEMASYFADQLAEQTSRGVRNIVADVRLLQGDLARAWAERGREYATVAMRFSMTDVTRDAATGRIVDGSVDEHVTATELWTFLRVPGGHWVLSAIQQAR